MISTIISAVRKYLLFRNRELIKPVTSVDIEKNLLLNSLSDGGRCLVVGSAPSVLSVDFEKICPDAVILMNGSFKLRDSLPKSVKTCIYMITDVHAYKDYQSIIDRENFDILILSSNIRSNWQADNLHYIDLYKMPTMADGFVERDLTKPLFHAHSVAHAACQVALAMGYKEIVLAGIDFIFDEKLPHFYQSSDREKLWAEKVSQVKAEKMIIGIQVFDRFAKKAGVKLLNASPLEKSLPGVEKFRFS